MREANRKRGESESERGYKVSPRCFWETCSSVKQKCSDEEERKKIVWREGDGAKKNLTIPPCCFVLIKLKFRL